MGKRLAAIVSSLLALPAVYAAPFDNIAQAMGTLWNAIGAFFSFQYVSQTPMIREGILKFLIFVLILRVVEVSLMRAGKGGKLFDNKTAGIIGFVVAAITVIFTPNAYLFSSVIALLVPAILIGYITWIAFGKLKQDCIQHVFGACLLLINMFIVSYTIQMFEEWNQFSPPGMAPFVIGTLNIVLTVVSIMFIVKLVMLVFCGAEKQGWTGGVGSPNDSSHATPSHETHQESPHESQNSQAQETPTSQQTGPGISPQTREEVERNLPEGQGLIRGVVVTPHDGRLRPVPDSTVWLEREGELITERRHTPDGRFEFHIPLNTDKILVHAVRDGFEEGVHVHGNPRTLIAITEGTLTVLDVRVPLFPEHVDPEPFDPGKHPVYDEPEDPVRPEDKKKEPRKKKPPPEHGMRIDLSPWFCPVEDQESFGACSAFAGGSLYEYLVNQPQNLMHSPQNKVSKLFLWIQTRVDGEGDPRRHGSNGFLVAERLKRHGVCAEEYWPWSDDPLRPVDESGLSRWRRAEEEAPNHMIEEHYVVDFEDIVGTLLDGLPMYVGVPVYDNFFEHRGGTIVGAEGSSPGFHAIAIVGYDSHRGDGKGSTFPAYKVRNSWGTPWGQHGYGWIEENTLAHLINMRGQAIRVFVNAGNGENHPDVDPKNVEKLKELQQKALKLRDDLTKNQEEYGTEKELRELIRKHKAFFKEHGSYFWQQQEFKEVADSVREFMKKQGRGMKKFEEFYSIVLQLSAVAGAAMAPQMKQIEKVYGHVTNMFVDLQTLSKKLDLIKHHIDEETAKEVVQDTAELSHETLLEHLEHIEGQIDETKTMIHDVDVSLEES